MTFKFKIEELGKVTYLQVGDLRGRVVPFFPCYHQDGTWELWTESGSQLVRMAITRMHEGKYFAKTPHSVTDIYVPYFDFMCKHAYWPDVVPFIEGIYDDLQNLGACVAKLDLFFLEWERTHFDARRFVTTELEYIFSVCRSLYDLLQESTSVMWSTFKFHHPKLGRKKLPKTFRAMILQNNVLMTKQQMIDRYAIPDPVADYYLRQAPFFAWLREFRDFVSHSGKSIEVVIATEKGFTVSIDTKPFSSMPIWSASNTQSPSLGSVLSLTAHIVTSTLKALEEFVVLMSQIVVFPDDIAPMYKVFLCGPNTANLQDLGSRLVDKPWYK